MLHRWILLIFLPLLLAGCVSQSPREIIASQKQLEPYLHKRVDVRRYGVTVYSSDEGHYFKNAFRTHPGQTAQFKFTSKKDSPFPVIDFAISSTVTLHALLDTSTRHSWITLDQAAQLGVKPMGTVRLMDTQASHVLDPLVSFMGFLWTMEMDNLQLGNIPLAVRPALHRLGLLERGINPPLISLVIGNDLLKEFSVVHFDFPNRKLVLATSRTYSPDRERLLARVPLNRFKDSVVVQARTPHYQGYFILDTAGDFELAMPSPESRVLDFFKLQDLDVSDVIVSDCSAWAASSLPRIGARLLANYQVTIDGENNMIYFEKP